MSQLNTRLTWGIISLQGILLLVDPSARNHIYYTFSSFNSVSLPFLQSFSENLRYIISLLLIPAVLYPRFYIIPKFAAIVAYVFFVCLHSNLIFFNQPTDIKCLLFQLLILGRALFMLVDDMIASEEEGMAKTSAVKRKNSALVKQQEQVKRLQARKASERQNKQESKQKGKGKKTK